jgi:hypothetical protein
VVKLLSVTSMRTAGIAESSTPANSGPPTPSGAAGGTISPDDPGCASA